MVVVILVVVVGFHYCNRAMVGNSRSFDDYGGIVIFYSVVGVISYDVSVGCSGCRIIIADSVVCEVAFSVFIVSGVVIYDLVAPPVCDIKSGIIAALHNANHLLGIVWHW